MTFSLVGYLFWARDWCQYNIGMDAHQSSPGLHLSDQTFGNLFAIFYARHRTKKIQRICFNISNNYSFTISNHYSSQFFGVMLDHTCMHYLWSEQCIRKIIRLGLQKSYYQTGCPKKVPDRIQELARPVSLRCNRYFQDLMEYLYQLVSALVHQSARKIKTIT